VDSQVTNSLGVSKVSVDDYHAILIYVKIF